MALQAATPVPQPTPQVVSIFFFSAAIFKFAFPTSQHYFFFSLQIGSAFVQQYYHILHQSPESVYKFYQDTSMLSRSDADGVMTSVTTMQVNPCFSVQTMFYLVIFFINLLMLGNNVCACKRSFFMLASMEYSVFWYSRKCRLLLWFFPPFASKFDSQL